MYNRSGINSGFFLATDNEPEEQILYVCLRGFAVAFTRSSTRNNFMKSARNLCAGTIGECLSVKWDYLNVKARAGVAFGSM